MPDDPDPPRKFYTMKPREIERLNPAPGQTPKTGAIDVREHFASAAQTGRVVKKPTGPSPAPPPFTQVTDLVRTNTEKEKAAGLNAIDFAQPKRPSRRKRDYVFLMIAGNLIIVGSVAIASLAAVTVLFGLAGVVMFSACVTWIMWGVMDNY